MKDSIGTRIKNLRKEKGLTLEDIAKRANLSKATIQRYESGVIINIPIDKVEIIAKALDTSPAYLMGWEQHPGRINRSKNNKENISKNRVPLIGTIAASVPISAEENIEQYFTIDPSVKADFALRVQGDSMIDAGIHDGDIAFLRKQQTLETGEIGAVIIGSVATLKRFYKTNSAIVLQPENKEYLPIIITEGELHIAGKLVAVLNIVI